MADTSVTYAGDGINKAFAITFPYITNTHVQVELHGILMATPADYLYTDATTVTFTLAPGDTEAVVLRRVTPGDARLVNFANGAVLTEADLDLSANQNFYLAQEAKENYSDLIYAEMLRIGTALGITSTTPEEWLASAVDTMLASDAAAALNASLTDIATNGESILDNAQLLQLLGDANGGRTAFTIDETTTLVDSGALTMAAKFAALVAADGDALAAVATEATARITADDITASTIALIGAKNGTDTAFVIETSTVFMDVDAGETLSDVLATHSVVLDVNDYITGFHLMNDGTTSSFRIATDEFLIVDPAGGGAQAGTAIFRIVGGVVYIKEAHIEELTVDKLITGNLLADVALTSGSITLSSTGYIKGGQTAYDTGTGFWLGRVSSVYKFSIGNASGNKMTWDGTDLLITGILDATGIEGGNSRDNPFQIRVDGTELANIDQFNYVQEVGAAGTGRGTAFSGTNYVYTGDFELMFYAPEDAARATNPRYVLAHREQPLTFDLYGQFNGFTSTDMLLTLEYRYNNTGGWSTATTFYSYLTAGSGDYPFFTVQYHPKATTYNTISFRVGAKQNVSSSIYYKFFGMKVHNTNLGKNSGASGGALA